MKRIAVSKSILKPAASSMRRSLRRENARS